MDLAVAAASLLGLGNGRESQDGDPGMDLEDLFVGRVDCHTEGVEDAEGEEGPVDVS